MLKGLWRVSWPRRSTASDLLRTISQVFVTKCNFLQYYSILSSIPQNWKKLLQEDSKDPVTPPTSICSLSCKAIYSILLNPENLPPPTSEKKILASGVEKSDLNKIYFLAFRPMRELKVTMFQYILPTNSLSHKMKKVFSPSCPFCPSECQTLWHLFINCTHASFFLEWIPGVVLTL